MFDKAYARPGIPIVLSLMAGIAAGDRYPGMGIGCFVGLAAAAVFLGYCLKRRKETRLVPLLVFGLLGYIAIQPWASPRFPPHHIVHHTASQKWRITGTIDSRPVVRDNRSTWILDAEKLESGGRSTPVVGRIRVTMIGAGIGIGRGDRVAFDSRLRRVRSFRNPGGFDYRRHLAFEKIWATAFCRQDGLMILGKAAGSSDLSGWLDRVRYNLNALIDRMPPGDHRGVLAALILGDRSRLSAARTETFHRVGIGHLLAISGLHIGIVATTVFFIVSRCLAWIPWFLWNASTRKWAAVTALPPVVGYAVLSGMSPSTQRALIMVGVFLLTYLIKRDQDLLNSLALAAMALLVIHPPVLFSISFQFSFIAVLAIIYGLSCFKPDMRTGTRAVPRNIANNVAVLFLVSFWATIGTLPLALYYFNQVSLIGLLANSIFVPLIGFGVVPCGLLAAVILPFSPWASAGVLRIAAGILEWALEWVDMLSPLPFAAVRAVTPSLVEIALYGLFVWTVLKIGLTFRTAVGASEFNSGRSKNSGREGAAGGRHHRRPLWILLVVVAAAMAVDVCYWSYQRFWRRDLRVTVLDVGQGSAALIELPGGACMLIDGGGYADNAVFDIGARVIAPYLWRNKIKTVETIVMTHPNSDHLNGLLYIAENFNVQTAWTNGDVGRTAGYRQFGAILNEKGIDHPEYHRLDRIVDMGGVLFEIVHPLPDDKARIPSDRRQNLNDNSLVIRARFDRISFLFPGDITSKAEGEIVKRLGEKLKSTVLVIPHHGSASSSSTAFVRAVQPSVGLVSAGQQNRYKFPHPRVIERYRRQQTRLLRTDTDGAVLLTTDGRTLSVRTTTGRRD
jgi:competence protein ComEC